MLPRPLYIIHVHPQHSCSAEHSGTSDSMSCPRCDFGGRGMSLASVSASPGGLLTARSLPKACPDTLPYHTGCPCAPYLVLFLQAAPCTTSFPVCVRCSGYLLNWSIPPEAGWALLPCEGYENETGKRSHITPGHLLPRSASCPL